MDEGGTFPSIPSQVAFRLADRRNPGLTTMCYEMPVADHVVPEILERAIARVYHRHEVMRTTLVEIPSALDVSSAEYLWSGFRNVVAERPVVSFELSSPEPVAVRTGTLGPARSPDAGEPGWLPGIRADPGQLPVFRFRLIEGEQGRILRVITDHSLCDRWSLLALQPDIDRAYRQELLGEPLSQAAPPFSSLAGNLYSLWTSGAFDDQLLAIEKKVAALDMMPLSDTGERPPDAALIQSFVLSLSRDSTRCFEAIYGQLKATRLTVAIALFSQAVGAEFGWHRLALLLPRANRSAREVGSVGLFADAQYIFTSAEGDQASRVTQLSADLRQSRVRLPPPANLVQASPAMREVLLAVPRMAADVLIRPTRSGSGPAGRSGVFIQESHEESTGDDEDTIAASSPPSFPRQPDIRFLCDFGQRHQFCVNFRVDRVPRSAALSIAERLLAQIRESKGL